MTMAGLHAQGKVRDIYEAGDDLLIVATDRISAFDVVLPTPIPGKGQVLSGLSLYWFDQLTDLVPNHLLTARVEEFPPPFRDRPEALAGRAMLVRRAEVVPVECVARGYITGSGWKDYRRTGSVCGISLPAGLAGSARDEAELELRVGQDDRPRTCMLGRGTVERERHRAQPIRDPPPDDGGRLLQ